VEIKQLLKFMNNLIVEAEGKLFFIKIGFFYNLVMQRK